ncbi:MAG: hypothetical protein ACRC8S_21105 [Fimbriiglobus sp.]
MDAKLLRSAVWLRAQGESWDAIGIRLRADALDLEMLPATHTEEWEALMQEFTPMVLRDSMLQAMGALRTQAKSLDEKISQTAAVSMLKYDIEEKKLKAKREALLADEAKAAREAQILEANTPDTAPSPEAPEPPPPPSANPISNGPSQPRSPSPNPGTKLTTPPQQPIPPNTKPKT